MENNVSQKDGLAPVDITGIILTFLKENNTYLIGAVLSIAILLSAWLYTKDQLNQSNSLMAHSKLLVREYALNQQQSAWQKLQIDSLTAKLNKPANVPAETKKLSDSLNILTANQAESQKKIEILKEELRQYKIVLSDNELQMQDLQERLTSGMIQTSLTEKHLNLKELLVNRYEKQSDSLMRLLQSKDLKIKQLTDSLRLSANF